MTWQHLRKKYDVFLILTLYPYFENKSLYNRFHIFSIFVSGQACSIMINIREGWHFRSKIFFWYFIIVLMILNITRGMKQKNLCISFDASTLTIGDDHNGLSHQFSFEENRLNERMIKYCCCRKTLSSSAINNLIIPLEGRYLSAFNVQPVSALCCTNFGW